MLNTTMVSAEIPNSAGTETIKQSGAVQPSGSSKKQPLAFKKKLEDCIQLDDTPYGVPAMTQTNDLPLDNSMAINLTQTQTTDKIVGILEGFGLLDYQSDLPLVTPQSSQTTDEQTTAAAADILLQGLTQNAEQTGVLEKYARMLSNDQLSKLPEEMQQAITKAVGDYLGSFESTNMKSTQTAAAQESAADVTSASTQTENASAQMPVLPENVASLLIKLKTMPQDEKPAETMSRSDVGQTTVADTSNVTVKPQTEPVATETGKPVSADFATAQTVADKPTDGNSRVDKAEIKTLTVDDAPQQKTDTLVQTTTQPAVSNLTDTDDVQIKANVPQTTQTDFVKDNVMRIVDKISAQVVGDGNYDFDVELKPDFLGKVSIKLSMQNGEMRMQIKTDDVGVKGMFTDQASSMQAVLKDKGITITNIDVTYQSQMQTGDEGRSFSQSGNQKKQSGRVNASLESIMGAGVFETMSEITGYTLSGSSVEYLV